MNYLVKIKEFQETISDIKKQLNKNSTGYKRGSMSFKSGIYDNLDTSLDKVDLASI